MGNMHEKPVQKTYFGGLTRDQLNAEQLRIVEAAEQRKRNRPKPMNRFAARKSQRESEISIRYVWWAAFWREYERTGNQTIAMRKIGVTQNQVSKARETNPDEWAAQVKESRRVLAGNLEAEAIRRAVEGDREIVLYRGKPVFLWYLNGEVVPEGTEGADLFPLYRSVTSDTLLAMLLRAKIPGQYSRAFKDEAQNQPPAQVADDESENDTPVIYQIPGNGREQ